MKKFFFCLGVSIIMLAGVSVGLKSSPLFWPSWMDSVFVIITLGVVGGVMAYRSACAIGREKWRGRYALQCEMRNGVYLVIKRVHSNDRKFNILQRRDSPDEDEQLFCLDEPLPDDVFAIEVKRDEEGVTVEPYQTQESEAT